jgi:hypothetical protein
MKLFAWAGLKLILPISASQVARITNVSHWHLTELNFFSDNTQISLWWFAWCIQLRLRIFNLLTLFL